MATEKTKIEEIELTEEENQGQLRTYENDILKGLLAAANYETEEDNIHPVEIARNGVIFFTFRIRPLSEEEYQKCKDKNTKYVRNKQLGIKFPENTDSVRYRSALIYQATIKEDREKIWDNKEAWKALNVLTGIRPYRKRHCWQGEKDAVLELVDKISGYTFNDGGSSKKLIEAGGEATILHHVLQRVGFDAFGSAAGFRSKEELMSSPWRGNIRESVHARPASS